MDAGGALNLNRYNSDGSNNSWSYDSNGNLTSANGTNASGNTWSEVLNGSNSTFTFDGQQFSGSQLVSGTGFVLGSTIGGILGGNSLAGRIAGAAVLGTLGQSVGSILSSSGLSTALLGNGSLNASLFDSAVSTTVANFGGNLASNAIGNIAGTFSSLLFGEAAQALHLTGFAAGAFTTVGTSITAQLATNLGSQALTSLGVAGLDATFNPGVFVGNIGDAIGGYFGSYLAAQVVPPRGPDAAIGGRIGGAVGSFIGNAVPVIGNFIGSFVGSILGTVIGGLFDHHYDPWSQEQVGAYNGVLTITYWNYNPAGIPNLFTGLSNTVAAQANQVLALTRSNPAVGDITGVSPLNLVFNQNAQQILTAIYPDGWQDPFYAEGLPLPLAQQNVFRVEEHSTFELVDHAMISGGDPLITGALAAARTLDTTTPAIYADLLVAQDYERYRANAEAINTAMAANPQSDFTAGWNLTLMRAQALGLDRIVTHAGWTADLTDSHETIHDANGNLVQELTFNADGSVTTDTATVVFDFNFVDAHLSYGLDSRTYLTGPDGTAHDVTGATRLFFNDGHIDEADGNPLVDDLYYDSQYHDVYLAGVDPDAHYNGGGWREGRNPNAYFNTNYYLSRNPDIAAAGANPLDHYDSYGWREGRNPSALFSTAGYLRAYADVAATGTDPLAHFLQFGRAEGRGPWPFQGPILGVADFGANTGWSSSDAYPRRLADVNGDGMADIVGFGGNGVFVSLANGNGTFAAPVAELSSFTQSDGWTSNDRYPRALADVNGDGMADIVGFGDNGVLVSLATGNGNFAAPVLELGYFAQSDGWTSNDAYPRAVADVNGDGMADIVGFGSNGVFVSFATGNGNFAAPNFELPYFVQSDGWSSNNSYPHALADVNGDGRADIIGFGTDGVFVSLATGNGNSSAPAFELPYFAQSDGWTSNNSYPRTVADVNGDGMADIVGFGSTGVWVSFATGNGRFAAPSLEITDFAAGAGNWTSQTAYPRLVADVTGDRHADIVGFNAPGAFVSMAA